jgi:ribonucleotide reductase beta subunit family protein with ferritin-like domain
MEDINVPPAIAEEKTKKEHFVEPLLRDDPRLSIFPIQYDDIFQMYQKSVDCFWRPEEINMSQDSRDFKTLTHDEQYFIKMVLGFFSNSDLLVGENLALRFYSDIKIPEVRFFYGFQIMCENIHSHTYSLMIDSLIQDKTEKAELLNAVDNFDFVRKKADWAKKFIADKKSSFAVRLIAFLCVEGIFFSGSFSAIYYFKQRGLMPGLTFSNELISRDECLHADFAVLLYSKLEKRLPAKKVHEIVKEACELEKEFMTQALPCRLIGMNADLMCKYINFVSDRICLQLGYETIYGDSNPFDFMELISVETKSNFFERTVSEYALSNPTHDSTEVFNFDTEF